jgi:CBS domain-containing protein
MLKLDVVSKVIGLVREKALPRSLGQRSTLNVAAVMSSPAISCHPETTLSEAAHLMWTNDVGFLPVVERDTGRVVGVVTDRDALMGAHTQGKPLWEVSVSVAMAKPAQTCRPEMPLDEADRIMAANRVHRLPVVDGAERLVGVLSLHDVARKARAIADATLEREVGIALGAICAPRPQNGDPLH